MEEPKETTKNMKATIEGEPFELKPKNFKTGSTGYHANGRLIKNNKLYMVNILIVEAGSKKKK
jgi:hypothetical protein